MARGDGDSATNPHPVDRLVGRRVAEKRVALGYNQGDLGRALGLTFQQIQKYEKGTNRISASKLWMISQFFGVDISYFFEGLPRDSAEGETEALVPTPNLDYPPTRMTLEMSALAPQLSTRRQKLALDMVREMLHETSAEA
ncbi:helix-turn-helix transcriptional regulator [Brevundimonas goettingensis]|uniref:Helix-turn-helix transcriptional regulator n=2 Tax=Brevundimonas goettingensis TaxID=2774190 RepID=A0A975C569_9CAUL|nr:helix-turn-helix transcriptional regulator [Brevundimonas goettingensis]